METATRNAILWMLDFPSKLRERLWRIICALHVPRWLIDRGFVWLFERDWGVTNAVKEIPLFRWFIVPIAILRMSGFVLYALFNMLIYHCALGALAFWLFSVIGAPGLGSVVGLLLFLVSFWTSGYADIHPAERNT